MQLIRHTVGNRIKSCVATLGNFDGIHLGHRQLLEQLISLGKKLKRPSVVITFEPHPKDFFLKQLSVPRLMRFREKFVALKNFGVDYVFCLRFNQKLALLSAESFVKEILVDQLHVKGIVVGDDFRFGAKRGGDAALLKQLSNRYDFEMREIPGIFFGGERVSSTRVRETLQLGNLSLATELLGRSYRLSGKVIYGSQRGHALGFPTANIHLNRKAAPVMGIFAVRVFGLGKQPRKGVASIGIRPMFPVSSVLLEVHLLDFQENIYGRHLEVEFLHKLRDEEKFDSTNALISQMQHDVHEAKIFFKKYSMNG